MNELPIGTNDNTAGYPDLEDYDLWMNDLPKCPKCGHEDEDWWDGMPHSAGDGYEYETDCGVCHQHYKATMFIETKFTTKLL